MFCKTMVRGLLAVALASSAMSVRADVFNMGGTISGGTWTGQASLSFVTVGDAGNVADSAYHSGSGSSTSPGTGLGAVGNTFQMGKYDVTLGQYAQFLNAVAATDTYGCYNSGMAGGFGEYAFGISQSGSAGSYTYSVTGSNPQTANMPVYCESWLDAARFCNWLQNGQLTGSEGTATTEAGAFTLNGDTTSGMESRNANAKYFIPSVNEWYKCAYYVGGGTNAGYWTYPTQSNTAPGNSLALAVSQSNEANFYNGGFTDSTNYLTPVSTFSASPGPYGTYDMGGDLLQWNEAIIDNEYRGVLGGYWDSNSPLYLASSAGGHSAPTNDAPIVGFRVASSVAVPEPSTLALLIAGAVGLLAFAWRRRTHAT